MNTTGAALQFQLKMGLTQLLNRDAQWEPIDLLSLGREDLHLVSASEQLCNVGKRNLDSATGPRHWKNISNSHRIPTWPW